MCECMCVCVCVCVSVSVVCVCVTRDGVAAVAELKLVLTVAKS